MLFAEFELLRKRHGRILPAKPGNKYPPVQDYTYTGGYI